MRNFGLVGWKEMTSKINLNNTKAVGVLLNISGDP